LRSRPAHGLVEGIACARADEPTGIGIAQQIAVDAGQAFLIDLAAQRLS
jgi:hypothetical protein